MGQLHLLPYANIQPKVACEATFKLRNYKYSVRIESVKDKLLILWSNKKTFYFVIISIVLVAVLARLLIFSTEGGDHVQYREAVLEFVSGGNPYKYTTLSFRLNNVEHGYAYFPTLLYILAFMWKLNLWTSLNIPTAVLWKIPVLIADLLITFMIFRHLYTKEDKMATVFGVFLWLFNPWFMARYEYTLFDPIQVMFLFFALYFMERKNSLSAIFFALAVSMKLTPIILLPIFLLKVKKPMYFILICGLLFFIISLPFLRDFYDFYYYVNGTILVHEERSVQGRPILSFLTAHLQNYGINFQQTMYSDVYALLAIVLGSVVTTYLILKRKVTDKYILVSISFLIYYIFTPVLSRTHILWGYPFFIIALYNIYSSKRRLFYISNIILYVLIFSYIAFWFKGFTIKPGNPKVFIDEIPSERRILPSALKLRNIYYDYRHKIIVSLNK